MECWLACYTMLFQQDDPAATPGDVVTRLTAGGFTRASVCRSAGLSSDEFPAAADALRLGTLLPGCLSSIVGVRDRLARHGCLWLAARLESAGLKWPHVVLLLGADLDRDQVQIVNPWMQSAADTPSKAWVTWQWVRNGVWGTESLDAGCQYLKS